MSGTVLRRRYTRSRAARRKKQTEFMVPCAQHKNHVTRARYGAWTVFKKWKAYSESGKADLGNIPYSERQKIISELWRQELPEGSVQRGRWDLFTKELTRETTHCLSFYDNLPEIIDNYCEHRVLPASMEEYLVGLVLVVYEDEKKEKRLEEMKKKVEKKRKDIAPRVVVPRRPKHTRSKRPQFKRRKRKRTKKREAVAVSPPQKLKTKKEIIKENQYTTLDWNVQGNDLNLFGTAEEVISSDVSSDMLPKVSFNDMKDLFGPSWLMYAEHIDVNSI